MHHFLCVIHMAKFKYFSIEKRKKKQTKNSVESSPFTRIILKTDLSAFTVIQIGLVNIKNIELKLERNNSF